MTLTSLPLGFSRATGRAAVDQTLAFKQRLCEKLGSRELEGCWMETVVEGGRMGVQVTFDPDVAVAEAWAARAMQAASGVWEQVGKQSRERVKV